MDVVGISATITIPLLASTHYQLYGFMSAERFRLDEDELICHYYNSRLGMLQPYIDIGSDAAG
jgi:hypothetical protein